ncbi:tRNA pseudouridine synthase A-like isoform X1 [Lolium rigidum]|uniref:tRNA pseudouridine synthase A-like isoform X1 n=2 Tax=Lolium rigidum TaxID=89674 RepID=UPI001F5D8CA2|nr:tRNA pseudouridine synthase A-like isoform X1 [Lolium rigidum]
MAAASPPPSPPHPKRPKMSSSSDPDPEPTSLSAAGADPGQARRRYKRRKVAILLAYLGAGYQGMQKNPGARTIEGDLEEALYQAGAVPEAERAAPARYEWARAARTDKGVSAAAQVVSGRFYVDPPGFIERLNAKLAPQIRAFGYVRVTNSFSAKKFCDRRRYVYLLPMLALDPSAHPDREAVKASAGSGNELAKCLECSERGRKVPDIMGREGKLPNPEEEKVLDASGGETVPAHGEVGSNGSAISVSASSGNGTAAQNAEPGSNGAEKFDIEQAGSTFHSEALPTNTSETICSDSTAGSVSVAASVVAEKEHNSEPVVSEEENVQAMDIQKGNGEESPQSTFAYTNEVKEKFSRILKHYVGTRNFHNFTTRTKAEDPAAKRFIISFTADRVVSLDGIDFVRCEVVGQSFMLHQIRKMVGLAVAVMRNCAPESIYDVAFRKDIRLNVPTAPEVGLHLDECMFTSYNMKWKDTHEAVSIEPYAEDAEDFKIKYIFPHIAAMEHKEGAVALWLHSLNSRNYPDFRYMETTGSEARVGAGVGNTEEALVPAVAGIDNMDKAQDPVVAGVENIEEAQDPVVAGVEKVEEAPVPIDNYEAQRSH